MKRARLAMASLLAGSSLLAACSAPAGIGERSAAIINGTTDDSDTAVVLVGAQVSPTMGSLCTGEIVSPHVVLTAAHCLDPKVLMTSTPSFTVFTGTTLSKSSPRSQFLQVQETHFDDKFDGSSPQNGHDVGVVILAQPTTIAPIPYNRTSLTQSMVGSDARFVGYGITSGTDKQASSAGTRRTAPTKLASIDDLLLGFQDGNHGICEGDSGGPALMTIGGKEVIAGITSFGLEGCPLTSPDSSISAGNDTRIDTYDDFVDKYVDQFDPPPKSAGDACDSDADCYPRACQQTSVGKICVQSCDPAAMTSSCPAGTGCTDVDGQNLCAAGNGTSGNKKGGCSIAGHAAPSSLFGFALLFLLAVGRKRSARS